MNTKDAIVDHLLTDFLEIHYSRCPDAREKVKKKLSGRRTGKRALHHVPSFALKDTLVSVQKMDAKKPAKIVLLNPHKESFETYRLVKSKP